VSRRDELAAVRERDREDPMNVGWQEGVAVRIAKIAADRRFLLGVVDDLAAALAWTVAALNDPEVLADEAKRRARALLADLSR
jgi:hypothetical protein